MQGANGVVPNGDTITQRHPSTNHSAAPLARILLTDFVQRSLVEAGLSSPLSHANGLSPTSSEFAAELKTALWQLGREFESRTAFKNIEDQLSYHSVTEAGFREALDELFHDGVNWGRVTALFVLTGVQARNCVRRNEIQTVPRLIDWSVGYMEKHLWPWMSENHGWFGLLRFYENGDFYVEDSQLWSSLKTAFKIVGLGAGLLAMTSFLTNRS